VKVCKEVDVNYFVLNSFNKVAKENERYIKSFIKKRVWIKDDVDDIFQTTLMECFKSSKNFRGDSHPRTWMCGVASKVISGYMRKNYRNPTEFTDKIAELSDSLEYESCDLQRNPENHYETRVLIEEVMKAYSALPEDMKQVFESIKSGASYEEASKLYNIPIGTVRSRISRAREKIKGACYEWGY